MSVHEFSIIMLVWLGAGFFLALCLRYAMRPIPKPRRAPSGIEIYTLGFRVTTVEHLTDGDYLALLGRK